MSVGRCVSPESVNLAHRLGVELDADNYPVFSSFNPAETSKPDMFICGASQSPQNIPSSVVSASAAAGVVEGSLSESRWSLTITKEVPEEIVKAIRVYSLNRLVVAACTPRTHETIFQETAITASLEGTSGVAQRNRTL